MWAACRDQVSTFGQEIQNNGLFSLWKKCKNSLCTIRRLPSSRIIQPKEFEPFSVENELHLEVSVAAGSDPLVDEDVHVFASHVENGPGEGRSAHHLVSI
jgi:hypothetical protein